MQVDGKLGNVLSRLIVTETCSKCDRKFPKKPDSPRELCFECDPPAPVIEEMTVDITGGDVLDVLADAGVNCHRYKNATLDTFRADEDPDALVVAQNFVEDFAASARDRFPTREWLFFYGTNAAVDPASKQTLRVGKMGNGKTHLAIAIARQLVETNYLRRGDIRFITAEELLLTIEATYRNDSGDSVASLLRRFGSYKLVIIDDFGVRKPTDHVERIFDELCKRREGQATIWTSNLGPKQIGELGLSRIFSRFRGNARSVPFSGRDRRGGN
jgi:DNA replication protein DnaC